MKHEKNGNVDNQQREKRFSDSFYSSQAWRKCANAYKRSVGGLCEKCRRRGRINVAEEVHHKIHLTPENINRPEITLNWKNLIALCKDCHKKEHRKEKRWSVDEDGNVKPKDPP